MDIETHPYDPTTAQRQLERLKTLWGSYRETPVFPVL